MPKTRIFTGLWVDLKDVVAIREPGKSNANLEIHLKGTPHPTSYEPYDIQEVVRRVYLETNPGPVGISEYFETNKTTLGYAAYLKEFWVKVDVSALTKSLFQDLIADWSAANESVSNQESKHGTYQD